VVVEVFKDELVELEESVLEETITFCDELEVKLELLEVGVEELLELEEVNGVVEKLLLELEKLDELDIF
jgi:hypothetical protein